MISAHLKPPLTSDLQFILNIRLTIYAYNEDLHSISYCQYFNSNLTTFEIENLNYNNFYN